MLRLVVAAVIAGVLLAVACVPVAAVAMNVAIGRGSATHLSEDMVVGGHRVVTTLDRSVTGTRWHRTSTPQQPLHMMVTTWGPDDGRVFEFVPDNIWIDHDGHARSASLWLVGWPMRSAYGVRRTGPPLATVQRVGLVEPSMLGGSWALPLIPHPPGMLANIAVYTGFVLGLLVAVRWLRLRRRARLGLCIACGYDMAGGDMCPECGLEALSP